MSKKNVMLGEKPVLCTLLAMAGVTQSSNGYAPAAPQRERNRAAMFFPPFCGVLLAVAILCMPYSATAQTYTMIAAHTGVVEGQNTQAERALLQPQAGEDTCLNLAEAENVRLGEPGSYHEIMDATSPYAVKLVVSTKTAIQGIKILALSEPEADNAGNEFFTAKVLYRIAALTPEKPLLLGIEFPGSIPPRGIAYTDTDGSQRAYAIVESGFDGSHSLKAIHIRQ